MADNASKNNNVIILVLVAVVVVMGIALYQSQNSSKEFKMTVGDQEIKVQVPKE